MDMFYKNWVCAVKVLSEYKKLVVPSDFREIAYCRKIYKNTLISNFVEYCGLFA